MTGHSIRTVGFVGVGNMGGPMARRLAAAGYRLQLYDAQRGRATALAAETGAVAAASLGGLGSASDAVITMLPDSRAVGAVLFDAADGIAGSLRPGATVIEMSSGTPSETVAFSQRLAERDIGMIDAPVSGGVQRAATGELAIMVGGDDATFDRCRSVLSALGTSMFRTGLIGSGQAMKSLNNLASAGGFLIAMEALVIGRKFGLDANVVIDVLNASTGMNNSTQKKLRQFVLSGTYASGFGLDLMVKDLSTALQVGRETGTATPFAALCREMWASAVNMLGPGADHTAMAKVCEMLGGDTLDARRSR